MKKLIILLFAAILCLPVSPALAALGRVWVSSLGADSLDCGAVTNPCRQISFVLSNDIVAPGGDVYIRDPSAFAPFSIPFSVSIVNDSGGTVSIQQNSQGSPAIRLKIAASDLVLLKGLTFEGLDRTSVGVLASPTAGNLLISDCQFTNFTNAAILIQGAPSVSYSISNSTVTGSTTGIVIFGSSTFGTITNVRVFNNRVGISIAQNSRAMMTDVAIENNRVAGLLVNNGLAFLRRATIMNNNIGILNGTTVFSYGDNSINANLTKDILNPSLLTRIGTQ